MRHLRLFAYNDAGATLGSNEGVDDSPIRLACVDTTAKIEQVLESTVAVPLRNDGFDITPAIAARAI